MLLQSYSREMKRKAYVLKGIRKVSNCMNNLYLFIYNLQGCGTSSSYPPPPPRRARARGARTSPWPSRSTRTRFAAPGRTLESLDIRGHMRATVHGRTWEQIRLQPGA